MGRDFELYIEVCHCGHHRATHLEERRNCLGLLCDCVRFADRLEEERPRPLRRGTGPSSDQIVDPWPDDYDTGDP